MIGADVSSSEGGQAQMTKHPPSAPGSVSVHRVSALLEREDDLAAIDRALTDLVDGEGAVLLVEGAAGIGKSSLLAELRRRARARQLTVLTARAGEGESVARFGVVRQLLERVLASARNTQRDEFLAGAAHLAEPVFDPATLTTQSDGDPTYATLHGLYWLVANLAERGPLILSVDDLHWADDPSCRFLLHLARRLAGLPVLAVLAVRSGTEQHRPDLGPLLLEARDHVIRPLPLNRTAVEQLTTAAFGGEVAAVLAAACHEATGGNPFLLSELFREIRRRRPDELAPNMVRRLGPDRIAASLLLRVRQVDRSCAPALARAVAVLGEQAGLLTCAQLAGLDPRRSREIVDELVRLAVLEPGEPLRFIHPIVRTAIYDNIPAAQRTDLHARAAKLLAEQDADPEAIAVHVMATDPAGIPEVVIILRAAAGRALGSGAPDTAATLLSRALAEPPREHERPLVLFELGRAEHNLGRLAAREHLLQAARTAADPVLRARALITLAVSTQPDSARQRAQLELYEQAARDVLPLDRELALQLHGVRLGALLFNLDLPVRFEDEADDYRDLPAETPAECLLLSFAARKLLADGEDVQLVGAIAERAAARPAVPGGDVGFLTLNLAMCLLEAERYNVAEQFLTRAVRRAEKGGSRYDFAFSSWLRGLIRHARGDLHGAEADARATREPNPRFRSANMAIALVGSLTDSGRYDEAEDVLTGRDLDGELPPILPMNLIMLARARLRAASGNLEAARIDLEELLRRVALFRGLSPLITLEAPLALASVRLALGDVDGARALADRTLQVATRARSRRAIGAALRISGLAIGGVAGQELLRRAVDTLRSSPALLWRAEALIDLGANLRRHGHGPPACDALREGMDIAHRCGAVPLADRAAAELRAAGARPRRRVTTGADALTPSERRVTEMAVAGMTNKQIAQALFVTLRTVELHLSNAYTKLGIKSRQDLRPGVARSVAAAHWLNAVADTGADLLVRVKIGRNLPVCHRLGDGSYL